MSRDLCGPSHCKYGISTYVLLETNDLCLSSREVKIVRKKLARVLKGMCVGKRETFQSQDEKVYATVAGCSLCDPFPAARGMEPIINRIFTYLLDKGMFTQSQA